MNSELIQGFSTDDSERIKTHLAKLLPHLGSEEVVLVGGLAIRYHLANNGVEFEQRAFNDLDFIATSPTAVRPTIIDDFLISHYHPLKGNAFYIV